MYIYIERESVCVPEAIHQNERRTSPLQFDEMWSFFVMIQSAFQVFIHKKKQNTRYFLELFQFLFVSLDIEPHRSTGIAL
jgi:hypothetical protein